MQKPVQPETPELAKAAANRANIVTLMESMSLLVASGFVIGKDTEDGVDVADAGQFASIADEAYGIDPVKAAEERKSLADYMESLVVYQQTAPKRGRKKAETTGSTDIVTGNAPVNTSAADKPGKGSK
jgi:hypothetical protein